VLFSTPKGPDWLWDPQSVLFSGYYGLKREELEIDLPHASSADINNEWRYASTLLTAS